jgi:5-methylcytosine-specific restriction enzyme A
MKIEDGNIVQHLGLRGRASEAAATPSAAIWKRRAQKMDRDIQTAIIENLPIRVVVCNGKMRDVYDPAATASQVTKRILDPVPWAVTSYDFDTGQCTLTRGGISIASHEAYGIEYEGYEGELLRRFTLHRRREARLRSEKLKDTLLQNGGRLICEVPNCGFDFAKKYGTLGAGYAHVHHKEQLSLAPISGRKVALKDLAIVCAKCHAMIHVGGQCRPLDVLIP